MTAESIVVGIAALAHDAAACLVVDGRVVAAAEEERFTRRKHQGGLPARALRWCLESAGIDVTDIDAVGVGIDPDLLAARRAAFGGHGSYRIDEEAIREVTGIEAPIEFVRHHLAHAASAFDCSPFDEAAVLVVDGVGEWDTTTIWHGSPADRTEHLQLLESIDFPHSLGLFYAAITDWLGFRPNNDEYKVMGLASHGSPHRAERIGELVPTEPDAPWRHRLHPGMIDLVLGDRSRATEQLAEWLGPPRRSREPLRQMHADLAAAAQRVLEDRVIALAKRAGERTGSAHLCAAGGVMLNAVANRRIRSEAGFDDVWFQPVAGDAGTALGAALLVARRLGAPAPAALTSLELGPPPSTRDEADPGPDRVHAMLTAASVPFLDLRSEPDALFPLVAELIAGGAVVGWCDGPSEFGPRALGRRSILADPRPAASRDRINERVKEREPWRPLAPMVAEAAAADLFEPTTRPHSHRFMIETIGVLSDDLAATTHVDRTARPQLVDGAHRPRLGALLDAVRHQTGVPAVVNTSFNHSSEPIVATAEEALVTAVRCGLDALVIGDIVVTELPAIPDELIEPWCTPDAGTTSAADQLYPL